MAACAWMGRPGVADASLYTSRARVGARVIETGSSLQPHVCAHTHKPPWTAPPAIGIAFETELR